MEVAAMSAYSFVTVWRLAAPIDRVWDAIRDSERWPTWWSYVVEVRRLTSGDEQGVGERFETRWRTRLPYTLAFTFETTRVERPHLLEGRASGELEGLGRWRLQEEGGITVVQYEWQVSTNKAWMNLLAPIARPAFSWNHDAIMNSGGEGLARYLGVQLVGMSRSLALT
jgi:uncharacterized protein YndB with AHSA1/START domain